MTTVIGTGLKVALKYYICFNIVECLISKKISFDKFDSDKRDGNINVKIYYATFIVIGERLFSIYEAILG